MSRKIFAISLLLTLTAAALRDPSLSGLHQDPRPAACHGHGLPLPAPNPDSHKCCQIGHQTALLQAAIKAHPSLLRILFVADDPELNPPHLTGGLSDLLVLSSSPPTVTPLRI